MKLVEVVKELKSLQMVLLLKALQMVLELKPLQMVLVSLQPRVKSLRLLVQTQTRLTRRQQGCGVSRHLTKQLLRAVSVQVCCSCGSTSGGSGGSGAWPWKAVAGCYSCALGCLPHLRTAAALPTMLLRRAAP